MAAHAPASPPMFEAQPLPTALLAAGVWLAAGRDVKQLAGCEVDLPSDGLGEAFVAAAAAEKMVPVVSTYARAHGWRNAAELEALSEIHAGASRALYDGVAGVVEELRTLGVEMMLVKGGALDLTVYPDDVPRAMDDLDFLVKAPDLDLVVARLEAASFVQGRLDRAQLRIEPLSSEEKAAIAAQHYELAPFFKIVRLPALAGRADLIRHRLDGYQLLAVGDEVYMTLEIDVHFNLSLGFDVADLWEFRERRRLPDGTEVQVQAVTDLAWFIAARAYHEIMALGRSSLRQFVDCLVLLAARAGDVDWDRLVRTAEKYDLHPSLFYVLWHAEELLPGAVPSGVIEACRPGRLGVKRFHDWGDFVPKLLGGVSVVPLRLGSPGPAG